MATALQPPTNFITVQDAMMKASGAVNVIGIVIDLLPPKPTNNGPDFVITFNIWDPFCYDSKGLVIRAFKKPEFLPQIRSIGDVVMLTRINMQNKGFGLMGLFSWSTSVFVFPQGLLPEDRLRDEVANGRLDLKYTTKAETNHPELEHKTYIMDLLRGQSKPSEVNPAAPKAVMTPVKTQFQQRPKNIPPSKPSPVLSIQAQSQYPQNTNFDKKFHLLKDLLIDIYADLVVQIVKFFPNPMDDTADLYVTDYTSNSMVFLYLRPDEDAALHGEERDFDDFGMKENGSRKGWQGPFGQYTISVKLYSPHSDAVGRYFQEGDICFLKNIRTRVSPSGKLEARLSHDNRNPNQVNVRRINPSDPRVQSLHERREEYERKQNMTVPSKKSNKQKRQEKKAKKAQAAEERRQLEVREAVREENGHSTSNPTNQADTRSLIVKPSSNSHVVAAYPSQPLVPLSKIIQNRQLHTTHEDSPVSLPFINARYRTLFRVVDFWPPDLADFAHCVNDAHYNPRLPGDPDSVELDSTEYQTQSLSQQERRKWEWAFALLVEDAMQPCPETRTGDETLVKQENAGAGQNQLQLVVSHDAAEHLLNMDAVDLRRDVQALARLKEKMFTIWGDLEELKEENSDGGQEVAKPSCMPFECCVEEYGVRDNNEASGWKRMWRMFATRVK